MSSVTDRAANRTPTGQRPATPEQLDFLLQLVAERPDWQDHLNGHPYERTFDVATGSGKFISTGEASAAIHALLEVKATKRVRRPKPAAPPAAAPTIGGARTARSRSGKLLIGVARVRTGDWEVRIARTDTDELIARKHLATRAIASSYANTVWATDVA